jgi:hypothetical protein
MCKEIRFNLAKEKGEGWLQQEYDEMMSATRKQAHRDKQTLDKIMQEPSRGRRLQMMWSALRYEPSYPPVETNGK